MRGNDNAGFWGLSPDEGLLKRTFHGSRRTFLGFPKTSAYIGLTKWD